MNIRVETDTASSRVLIIPTGELDISTRRGLLRAVTVASDYRLTVFDLDAVTFMDCAGLSPIVMANVQAHARGGTVALVRPRPLVKLLLDLTGFDSLVGRLLPVI